MTMPVVVAILRTEGCGVVAAVPALPVPAAPPCDVALSHPINRLKPSKKKVVKDSGRVRMFMEGNRWKVLSSSVNEL